MTYRSRIKTKQRFRVERAHDEIRITVRYLDESLRHITGKSEEIIALPRGARSGDFFDFLEERYPEIFRNFGPGYLGFTLNGKKPHVLDALKDGDGYEFVTWTDEEIAQDEIVKRLEASGAIINPVRSSHGVLNPVFAARLAKHSSPRQAAGYSASNGIKLPKVEFTIPKWMECTWRRVTCGKDGCKICGRIKSDRLRHIMKGEDPDDPKSMFEDVDRSFKETLEMIRQDAKRLGIDIANIDDIQEPPKQHKFPFYKTLQKWHKNISELANDAEESESYWLLTEAAADILWYKNTLLAKVYRQLCNRWHIEQGDGYGDFDYQYTKYVLGECLNILKKSLGELSLLNSPQKGGLMLALSQLADLEKQILNI